MSKPATSSEPSTGRGLRGGGVHLPPASVLVLAVASGTSAQVPETVSGEVTCPECRIVLDTIATLGGLDGPGSHLIRDQPHVAVDGRGRLLVGTVGGQEFGVFDPDGTLIQIVGHRGEGPGEYEMIFMVVPGRSYTHVFDPATGLRTMLDHAFNVVRVDRLPARIYAAVPRSSDALVLNADLGTPTAAGHRFHILSPSGQVESFGGGDAVYFGRSPYFFALAGDGRNALWTVRRDSSIVTRWELEPEPKVTKVFLRDLELFEKDSPAKHRYPSAWNGDAMLDQDGLWIVWSTPDPEWTSRHRYGTAMPEVPLRVMHDGWLDLLDTETGKTVARLQNDGLFVHIAKGSRYIVAYHETDAGVPYIHLLNPRLVR